VSRFPHRESRRRPTTGTVRAARAFRHSRAGRARSACGRGPRSPRTGPGPSAGLSRGHPRAHPFSPRPPRRGGIGSASGHERKRDDAIGKWSASGRNGRQHGCGRLNEGRPRLRGLRPSNARPGEGAGGPGRRARPGPTPGTDFVAKAGQAPQRVAHGARSAFVRARPKEALRPAWTRADTLIDGGNSYYPRRPSAAPVSWRPKGIHYVRRGASAAASGALERVPTCQIYRRRRGRPVQRAGPDLQVPWRPGSAHIDRDRGAAAADPSPSEMGYPALAGPKRGGPLREDGPQTGSSTGSWPAYGEGLNITSKHAQTSGSQKDRRDDAETTPLRHHPRALLPVRQSTPPDGRPRCGRRGSVIAFVGCSDLTAESRSERDPRSCPTSRAGLSDSGEGRWRRRSPRSTRAVARPTSSQLAVRALRVARRGPTYAGKIMSADAGWSSAATNEKDRPAD